VHNRQAMTKLKSLRKQHKRKVAQIATAVGCHPQNYLRVERGDQVPKRELARAIYEYWRGDVTLGEVYDPIYAMDHLAG